MVELIVKEYVQGGKYLFLPPSLMLAFLCSESCGLKGAGKLLEHEMFHLYGLKVMDTMGCLAGTSRLMWTWSVGIL